MNNIKRQILLNEIEAVYLNTMRKRYLEMGMKSEAAKTGQKLSEMLFAQNELNSLHLELYGEIENEYV